MALVSAESVQNLLPRPVPLRLRKKDCRREPHERTFVLGGREVPSLPHWVSGEALRVVLREIPDGQGWLHFYNYGQALMLVRQHLALDGQKVGIRNDILVGKDVRVAPNTDVDQNYEERAAEDEHCYRIAMSVRTRLEHDTNQTPYTNMVEVIIIQREQMAGNIKKLYDRRFEEVQSNDHVVFRFQRDEAGMWTLAGILNNYYRK